MERATLHHADCRDTMRAMEADSVDAIVTDPPYGLAFMGREWDHGVPGLEFWTEALRVAKPGAHLVAFGGTRTFHRLACAIEDAGWEVRDSIGFGHDPGLLAYCYGSGFPKSLDVSKAIDKVNGEGNRLHKFTSWMRTTGLKAKQIDAVLRSQGLISPTSNLAVHYFNDGQPAIPTAAMWRVVRPLCGEVPSWVDQLVERIEAEREVIGTKPSSLGGTVAAGERDLDFIEKHRNLEFTVTAPATDAAKQWQGWGTALKPAWEPIILARKPLISTVAANVLAHGTGAINVDACRIGWRNEADAAAAAAAATGYETARARKTIVQSTAIGKESRDGTEHYDPHAVTGRWPANVALDEEAAAMLDGQSGTSTSAGKAQFKPRSVYSADAEGYSITGKEIGYGDSGGASRFFYTAKASRRERGEANSHPTVKPVALMRWLVRLVTPPNGLVLDPFNGSGSTGVAALAEGMRYVGCEREAEYVEITRRRLALPLDDDDQECAPKSDAKGQLTLW